MRMGWIGSEMLTCYMSMGVRALQETCRSYEFSGETPTEGTSLKGGYCQELLGHADSQSEVG